MRPLVILTLLLPFAGLAQVIDFQQKADTIYIAKGKSATHAFKIKCDGCQSATEFIIQKDPSGSFPAENIHVQQTVQTMRFEPPVKGNLYYFVAVNVKDSSDYGKHITIKKLHGKDSSYAHLYILPKKEEEKKKADSNRYRMMIGTNFDFVDGVQAKDLYYHLQFFVPEAYRMGNKVFGFIGGIQQNRQVSQLDTSIKHYYKGKGYFADSFRLSSYSSVGRDSFRVIRADQVTYQRTTSTNVMQLYIEPVFGLSNPLRNTESKLYFLLHADLQYRRVRFEEKLNYNLRDTVTLGRASFSKYTALNESVVTSETQYHFNYGAGILLHHQNEYVDMYAKMLLGLSSIQENKTKSFYATEVGIRVLNSNIMFGAEYRGLFSEHAPQYLNVYLSKAFALSKLADFLLK